MDKKEKNVQKHKMAVAIYREMSPEKQQEFVAENKKKFLVQSSDQMAKRRHVHAMLKAGREYVLKNKVVFFTGMIGGYPASAGALLQTMPDGSVAYKFAYAFCSPKDRPSIRMARGYIGWRLMSDKKHPYSFYIGLDKSGAVLPERLSQMARLHIEMDVTMKRVPVPTKLQRQLLTGCGNHLSPYPPPKKALSLKAVRRSMQVR